MEILVFFLFNVFFVTRWNYRNHKFTIIVIVR